MATVRLAPEQEAKLRYLAAARRTTLADVYREAIEEYLRREMPRVREEVDCHAWDEIFSGEDEPADNGVLISKEF